MNNHELQGISAPSFAMPALLPEHSETTFSDVEPDSNRNETDDFRTWNWVEAATAIGINESTLRRVWWEDALEPAFRHCPTPLRVVTRTVKKSGRQLEEFTAFGLQVLQAYKAAKATSERTAELFLAEARVQYPVLVAPSEQTPEPEQATVTVEIGNHAITLAAPQLPQTYSLESLRQSEVVAFDDPLAIAAQFLQTADALTEEMQRDIRLREQKLHQTQQAKAAIAEKANEFKLEARLYRERTEMLATAQSQETQGLQQSLTTLQGLGKPTASTDSPTGE